jgi:hypothetical protein
MAAANIASFFRGSSPASVRRFTGSAPTARKNGPMSGCRNNGALASTVMRRGNVPMISIGSTSELW